MRYKPGCSTWPLPHVVLLPEEWADMDQMAWCAIVAMFNGFEAVSGVYATFAAHVAILGYERAQREAVTP